MNPPSTPQSAIWHHPVDMSLTSMTSDSSTAAIAAAANLIAAASAAQPGPYKNVDTESVLSAAYSDRAGKKMATNVRTTSNGNGSIPSAASAVATAAAYGTVLMNSTASPATANSPQAILNPYHGNYQANTHSGQVHSVISMRSKNSLRNGQIPKASTTIESPYAITSNDRQHHQDLVQVSMMTAAHDSDAWNDNTTAITGNTSDQSGSMDDLSKLDKSIDGADQVNNRHFQCQMWSGTVIALVLSICAFLSPILMLILPRLEILEWKTKECGPECDGLVISFLFKELILAVGSWAVFFRRPKATMPRICVYRCAVLAMIVVFMVAYWLFYSVRIAEKRFSEEDAVSYYSIILFAISLVDALLFIHYLAVLLLQFRHLDTQYFIKVVRSPDGQSRCYNIGTTSIQRASVWILEKYYQDFPRYNPFLERISLRKARKNSLARHSGVGGGQLKYYDLDGMIASPNHNNQQQSHNNNSAGNNDNDHVNHHASITLNPLQLSPKSILAQNTAANAGRPKAAYLNGGSTITDGRGGRSRSGSNGHNLETTSHHSGHSGHHHHRHHSDRFHEEHDYERRVRKRKSRLINVTEEAFTHIKRVQQNRSKFSTQRCLQ